MGRGIWGEGRRERGEGGKGRKGGVGFSVPNGELVVGNKVKPVKLSNGGKKQNSSRPVNGAE